MTDEELLRMGGMPAAGMTDAELLAAGGMSDEELLNAGGLGPRKGRRDTVRPRVAPAGDLSRPAGALGQTLTPPPSAATVTPTDATWSDVGRSTLQGIKDVGNYFTSLEGPGFVGDLVAGVREAGAGAAGLQRAIVRTVGAPFDVAKSAGLIESNPLDPVANWLGQQYATNKAISKQLSPERKGLAGALTSGVKSAGQSMMMLPFGMGGTPAAMPAAMGATQVGQSYQEATAKGLSNTQALAFAIPQGVIEFATEKVPALKLLEDMQVRTPIVRMVMNNLAREVPGEQIATLTQDFNEWAALNPDQPFSKYVNERPSAALNTLLATLTTGGVLGAQSKALRLAAGQPSAPAVVGGFEQQMASGAEVDPVEVLTEVLKAKPDLSAVPSPDVRGARQYGAPVEDARYVQSQPQPQPIPAELARLQPQPGPLESAVAGPDPLNFSFPAAAPAAGAFVQRAAGPEPYGVGGQQLLSADDAAARGVPGDAADDSAGAAPAAPELPVEDADALRLLGFTPDEIEHELQGRRAPEVPAAPEAGPQPPGLDEPSNASVESAMRALGFSEDEIAADPDVQRERANANAPEPPELDAPSSTRTADAMRALGFSEEEINADPDVRREMLERLREGFYEPSDANLTRGELAARRKDEEKAGKVLAKNPLESLLRGKIKMASASDFGADLSPREVQRVKGGKGPRAGQTVVQRKPSPDAKYFSEDGMEVDELGRMLWEHGYFPPTRMPEAEEVYDMVRSVLGGEKVYPLYDQKHGGEVTQAQSVLEAKLQREQADKLREIAADDALLEILFAPEFPGLYEEIYNAIDAEHPTDAQVRAAFNDYFRRYEAGEQEREATGRAQAAAAHGSDEEGGDERAGVPGVPEEEPEEADDEVGPDEGDDAGGYPVTRAEREEFLRIRAIPYDERTQEQHDRFDELEEDYGNWRREHLFDEPEETIRAADEAKRTGYMSQQQADEVKAGWKATARAQKGNSNKTVLSLFDYTGEWSKPWAEAGYNVITVDIQNGQDLNDLTSIEHLDDLTEGGLVDVVLAACPCTDFAASGARWWAGKDADGTTKGSIELVKRTLAIIEYLQPDVWAIENPVGRIQSLAKLPDPRLIFQPHHYGDPYTKKTLLYGNFNPELPQANVEPVEGSRMHRLSSSRQAERSITPEGFAYSFFMANGGEGFSAMQSTAAPAPAAKELRLFHGTQDPNVSVEGLSRSADIGTHYSTSRETAELFASDQGKGGRVLEAVGTFRNPLELPDLQMWQPTSLARAIDVAHGIKPDADDQTPLLTRVWGPMEEARKDYLRQHPGEHAKSRDAANQVGWKMLREHLKDQGYDAIKYTNTSEGKPVDSYIALEPGSVRSVGAQPEEGLDTYTPEEIEAREAKARDEAKAKAKAEAEADAKEKAEREKKEIEARQRASSDNFQLGQDEDDAISGQSSLLDADLQSKVPPSGVSPNFQAQAFTQRPSVYRTAWDAIGIDPGKASNLPIDQQYAKLRRLYADHFGLKVTEKPGALTRETVDSMLDGFQNIQAGMAVLGLPANAVSLNGTLTVQFEKFKGGYLGAYAPDTRTIHMPGRSNSFGHEWMHALDHMMTTITGHGDPGELFSYVTRGTGANPNDRLQATFAELMNALFHDHAELSWKMLQLQVKAAEKTKAGKPSPGAKKAQRELDAILTGKAAGALKAIKANEYAMTSKQFDPSGASYWTNPAEMLARAFEAYLSSLRRNAPANEFMTKPYAAYLSDADARLALTFPKESDRWAIFLAFDQFFNALRMSNELGTGPAAQEYPPGQGLYDPARWHIYPNNQPKWRAILQAELDAFANVKPPSWISMREGAGKQGSVWGNWALATLASQRGHLNALARRYPRATTIKKLADMLYVDRGTGRAVGPTFHEATVTTTRSKLNRLRTIEEKHGITRTTADEKRLLRLTLTSEHAMTHPDVRAAVRRMDLDVSAERQQALMDAAADLRAMMDKEWYYNTSNGIKLGYTKNGYLPRVLNYERVLDDLDGFEAAAKEVYGVVFDKDIGTEPEAVELKDVQAMVRSLRQIARDPKNDAPGLSAETAAAWNVVAKLARELKKLERAMEASEDPDEFLGKINEKQAELLEAIGELLPLLREDYATSAAISWRVRIDTNDINDYDTQGPVSTYTKGRELPPEADVLMADYYLQDPMESIGEYMERSTRRVEYAKRFGADHAKLKDMEAQLRREGVSKEDRSIMLGMVNNATGRENHSAVPSAFTRGMNQVNGLLTMYMLGRATFASLAEPITAFLRTGDARNIYRPFVAMAKDAIGSADAQQRREIANLLGLVSAPFADAIMANRLTGETHSKLQSQRMTRFFERTLLGPLTRAQQRSMITVGHHYLNSLLRKDGHSPSEQELAELGIAKADQADFRKWFDGLDGTLPQQADLIDPHTGELHKEGALYGTAIKRFSDQVIMEPSKMDRPRLATNPVGRFAFGIMSFQYAFWNQVYKPTVKQFVRNAKTLATGSGAGNAGRTRAEAARGMALAGLGVTALYAGTLASTILRAALLDPDKWKEHEEKGDWWEWMTKLAATRMGIFGPLDPVVQAFVGLKYQRDMTSLTAGPQLGSIFQNIQDIGAWMLSPVLGTNSPNTNTAERKAAKGAYNLFLGPMMTWAAGAAPGGPITGVLATAVLSTWGGSSWAQEKFTTAVAGEKFNPDKQRRVKDETGKTQVIELTPEEMELRKMKKADKERAKLAKEFEGVR